MITQRICTLVDVRQPDGLAELEGHIHRELGNQVRHLELKLMPEGLLLQGKAATYHAQQLVAQIACEAARVPVINAIEVCPASP